MLRFATIEMGSSNESVKKRLRVILEQSPPPVIDEFVFESLRQQLAPVSAAYLRRLLKGSGVPLSPSIEGVSQRSLDDLRRSLLALELEYSKSSAAKARAVRTLVIEAKDRARWEAQRSSEPTIREMKQEMILWMLTWLENPRLFAPWVELRQSGITTRQASATTEAQLPEL